MHPLDHRGITVFSAMYRLANHVWWTRVAEPLKAWAHDEAFGGLPGREPFMAAFNT